MKWALIFTTLLLQLTFDPNNSILMFMQCYFVMKHVTPTRCFTYKRTNTHIHTDHWHSVEHYYTLGTSPFDLSPFFFCSWLHFMPYASLLSSGTVKSIVFDICSQLQSHRKSKKGIKTNVDLHNYDKQKTPGDTFSESYCWHMHRIQCP